MSNINTIISHHNNQQSSQQSTGNYCVLRSPINAYSFLSHEWWVPLIKFMMRLTIYVIRKNMHLLYFRIPNNFP